VGCRGANLPRREPCHRVARFNTKAEAVAWAEEERAECEKLFRAGSFQLTNYGRTLSMDRTASVE